MRALSKRRRHQRKLDDLAYAVFRKELFRKWHVYERFVWTCLIKSLDRMLYLGIMSNGN